MNTEVYVAAPIEPPHQAEMTARSVYAIRAVGPGVANVCLTRYNSFIINVIESPSLLYWCVFLYFCTCAYALGFVLQ